LSDTRPLRPAQRLHGVRNRPDALRQHRELGEEPDAHVRADVAVARGVSALVPLPCVDLMPRARPASLAADAAVRAPCMARRCCACPPCPFACFAPWLRGGRACCCATSCRACPSSPPRSHAAAVLSPLRPHRSARLASPAWSRLPRIACHFHA
jgi:hypothetical protein